MPPKIHDGSNNNNLVLDGVDHSLRKAAHSASAMMLAEASPSLWVEQDAPYRTLKLIEEVQA